jgi:hypothetical protein
MKALEEVGKGLIALANLIFALVVFKEAIIRSDATVFILGLLIVFSMYYLAFRIIRKSEEISNECD